MAFLSPNHKIMHGDGDRYYSNCNKNCTPPQMTSSPPEHIRPIMDAAICAHLSSFDRGHSICLAKISTKINIQLSTAKMSPLKKCVRIGGRKKKKFTKNESFWINALPYRAKCRYFPCTAAIYTQTLVLCAVCRANAI